MAHDLADLVDGSPTAPINVDELGNYDSRYTWTGTDNNGLGTTDTCADWSDSAADADIGISAGTAGLWSNASPNTLGCHFSFALYCLSDSPEQVTWWDLFESGDLSWWSAVVP